MTPAKKKPAPGAKKKKAAPASKKAAAPKKKAKAKPAAEPTPAEVIARLVDDYRSKSDPQLVAALGALPELRDEDDLVWDDPMYWAGVVYPYLALAQVAAERRLLPAVRLLLDRAALGDPGETMRGLRHSLEAIVDGDRQWLADACMAAIETRRPGTILWATAQLAILDDPRAFPLFEKLRHSEHEMIRGAAELGISRLVPDEN
jgi:hypothetical protein